tara:strand:+ start:299 stop:610 length:312 start_codon:yes stop_codon:yes gene_type:complete
MKGVKHYTKDGKEWKGESHKMDDGTLHSGKTHNEDSKTLVHKKELKKPSSFKMNGFPVHDGISPMAFKGADSSNSSCWKGYRKVGTKKSPSGTGKTVNDCEKI